MKRVYLASGFFNEKQIEAVEKVENILRAKGLNVWSPRENQLDQYEFGTQAWSLDTFTNDCKFLKASDFVVAISDNGNTSDAGTMVEAGMAYGWQIPVVCLHLENESNLMLHESAHANLLNFEELEAYDFEEFKAIKYSGAML